MCNCFTSLLTNILFSINILTLKLYLIDTFTIKLGYKTLELM